MRVVVIIPARYGSTRLPGKPLADLNGRPMIRHVVERASEAPGIAEVVVATDDVRVVQAVEAFGGRALMTSERCRSGTDRVAEAARALAEAGLGFDAVVNVQGDEPFLEPSAVAEAAALLAPRRGGGKAPMATLARPLEDGELDAPSVVKVVCDRDGYALYFSRAPLGRDREAPDRSGALAHVGLYAYTAECLQRVAALPQTPLEALERLEQLRVLEHGLPIAVGRTTWRSRGIDTPEDLLRATRTP